jgi:mono/diheme cytochrome c family protein
MVLGTKRLVPVVVAALLVLTGLPRAYAMPILMDAYNDHPQSQPKLRDNCAICHINLDGSGPLTSFGEKYDRAGLQFTPQLIAEYPNLFAGGDAGALVASHEDSSDPVMVPGNEPFEVKTYYKEECIKCHGKYGDGDPFQGVPAFATEKWVAERSPKTEELVGIILYGKDKMVGQAGRITEAEARELLELIRKIAEKYK